VIPATSHGDNWVDGTMLKMGYDHNNSAKICVYENVTVIL